LKRREFITLLGGASDRVLTILAEHHSEMQLRTAAFREGLERLGWSEGRNVQIDDRFASAPNVDQARVLAKELIALRPDKRSSGLPMAKHKPTSHGRSMSRRRPSHGLQAKPKPSSLASHALALGRFCQGRSAQWKESCSSAF
jgi:hypothetical protein